jgi:hypothetical protein
VHGDGFDFYFRRAQHSEIALDPNLLMNKINIVFLYADTSGSAINNFEIYTKEIKRRTRSVVSVIYIEVRGGQDNGYERVTVCSVWFQKTSAVLTYSDRPASSLLLSADSLLITTLFIRVP